MTIDPHDLEIQTTTAGIPGRPDGVYVKIIHKPTGWWGEARAKSELRARETAMQALRERMGEGMVVKEGATRILTSITIPESVEDVIWIDDGTYDPKPGYKDGGASKTGFQF